MSSFPCKIIEADLDADIVTLQMEGDYTVSAGQKYLCDAAAASAEPVAAPKGWRLVPVSPTKEMLLAGETDEYNTAIWWDLMLAAAPVSGEPVDYQMESIMGYRLEFKPGEYCYYTPEGYALEAYKGDAPTNALYASPQPGCPSEIEVYKGRCWVRPKYNYGNVVDETFQPLFLGPQLIAPVAAQPDLTQQTLDDVKAGIPARDAEIEALHRELETLRAQQPVSGADDRVAFEAACRAAGKMPVAWPDGERPDGTGHYRMAEFDQRYEGWQLARAALAQQDADKVDAERYRAWRDAACKNDRTLIDAMFEYKQKHFREGNPTPEQFNAGIDYALAAIDTARKEQT